MEKEISIPDICDYCQFHKKEVDTVTIPIGYTDYRYCCLFNRDFNINEVFDEDGHHNCRPDWCDVKSIEIKNGWKESL